MTDTNEPRPTETLVAVTDPYLSVSYDGDAVRLHRGGDVVTMDPAELGEVIDTLEVFAERVETPDEMPTGLSEMMARGHRDDDSDDAPTCPECGERLNASLGGDECLGCGWTEGPTDD